MSDIDTQIEEILDVLIMGYCPELIGDINKSFQYYTEAHKAIKALLIQQQGGLDKPDVAQVGGNQVDKFIQIAIDSHPDTRYGLHALDANGCVWRLEGSSWIELVEARHRVTDLAVADPSTKSRTANPQSKASLKRELT